MGDYEDHYLQKNVLLLAEFFEKLNELHVLHNDYPLALEKHATSDDMLSDYC